MGVYQEKETTVVLGLEFFSKPKQCLSSKSDVDVVLHNHCIDAKIGNIFSAERPSKFKASPKFLEVVGFLQLLLFCLPMRHPQLLQL